MLDIDALLGLMDLIFFVDGFLSYEYCMETFTTIGCPNVLLANIYIRAAVNYLDNAVVRNDVAYFWVHA